MRIACIGDSLTEGDYGVFGKRGIANVQERNYPFFLARSTGASVQNYGKCGITPSGFKEFYESGAVDVASADIIVVLLGTNGGLDPNTETAGNRDYDELICNLKRDAENAKIVLCTPPHVTENPEYSNCGYLPQVKNATEFVRSYAARNALDLIDLAAFDGFNADSEAIMQPNDGLHFSELGYQTLAGVIKDELKKLYPDLFQE